MYSVIIQNQKTIDEFTDYHPLFLEAMKKGKVGVCKWIESGRTIDTALPDLSYMTDDKDEWRAVIVRLEGDGTGGHPADLRNPYDFQENKDKTRSTIVEESNIPLIRLCQMLGGVPEPDVEFKAVLKDSENKNEIPHIIYEPVEDEESEKRNRVYEDLVNKYRFNGKPPKSIVIITVRKDYSEERISSESWKMHKESESSDFWKRNHYPSKCRFLVYDYKTLGNNHLEYDKFCFWMSILLLSLNEIDPSTLQAYRLYDLSIDIDKISLEDNFEDTLTLVRSVKEQIERELRREREKSKDVKPEIPEFEMTVDVPIEEIDDRGICVNPRRYGLFSSGILSETGRWTQDKDQSVRSFESAIQVAERTLDVKADQTRADCKYPGGPVVALDKFQREDMEEKINELYDAIIEIQENLPSRLSDSEKVNQKSEKVKNYLRKRFSKASALISLGLTAFVIILGFVFSFLDATKEHAPSYDTVMIPIAAGIVFSAVCAFIVVLIQKGKLNSLIREFNDVFSKAIAKLNGSTDNYSKYLSSVASHTRGCTYIVESEKIDYYQESGKARKMKHVKALSLFITKIRIWAKAFNLNKLEEADTYEYVEADTETEPSENELYTFETDGEYPVNLNSSGKVIYSPFEFVKTIRIEREELYCDTD